MEIKKSAPAPRKRLIKIYENENNYEKALKLSLEGEKIIDYDPDFSVETVQILVFLKKYEEAKKMALERLNKFPNNSALLFLYSYASFLLGQIEEAELYCEKSLSADKQNVDSVILLSEIMLRQHKIKDSFEILQKGLYFNPNDPRIMAKIAELSKSFSE
ncbi:MAG: hypothetical protein GYA35_02710 [Thermoanaerobaculaceae bacterium]|nr:hypothetical protein [Thermoanaerobaculaceae bacterium]